MVEPAELRPDELDRLEDALELLEVTGIDDPSPAVRDRLGDFRKILQLSRTALPLVDVPRGVLDRVMLEARNAAEVPAIAAATPAPAEPAPSLWTRLRRFALVPGVALAGAAVLVLVMVQRSDESTPVLTSSETVAKNEAPVDARAGDGARQDVSAALEQSKAPAPGFAAGESEAAPTPTSPAPPPAVTAVPAASPDERKAKGKDASGVATLDEDAPMEEPASDAKADPADGGTPRWDIIARGDRARHKGDCDGARTEYNMALADFDARVRARAHAGIGLCSAVEGSQGAADSAYKAARELDPEITGFIETERPRGGGTGSANASRAKAKKAKPASVDQQQKVEALDPMK
jgi:hypothetical protein